jgi:hypothetical protein
MGAGGVNRLWDTLFRDAFTWPQPVYFALWTAAGEANFDNYARKQITVDTSTFSASSAGVITNIAAITWPTCGTNINNTPVTEFVIYPAATGSGQYFRGSLTASQAPVDGDAFQFAVGALVINLA